MKTTYACAHCGGTNVFVDAYVSLNDPEHVNTFDNYFCGDCDGECSIVEAESQEEAEQIMCSQFDIGNADSDGVDVYDTKEAA